MSSGENSGAPGRLQPEDKIIGVEKDGETIDLVEKKLNDVVRYIRGPRGTKVRLIVQPDGTKEKRVYELTRQKIELKEQHAKSKVIEAKADNGKVVKIDAAFGVHLGTKLGRNSGLRLGYSQIANPLYLARKGAGYPLTRALGHLLASRSLLALNRTNDAALQGNLALTEMRAAGPSGGVLVPDLELTQGELLLRTGQFENARTTLQSAAVKLREATGPDAWVTTLFSLESVIRTASDLGAWPVVQDFADQMRDVDAAYPGTRYVSGLLAEHGGDRTTALARYQEALTGWADADADFPGRLAAQKRIAALK